MQAYTERQRVTEELTRRITSGQYPAGHQLPSGAQLCREFDVSVMAARQAVDWLKALGLVQGVPGKGVFVSGMMGVDQVTAEAVPVAGVCRPRLSHLNLSASVSDRRR